MTRRVQLREIIEAEINLDALSPAKFIFENILKKGNGDSVDLSLEFKYEI